MRGFQVTPGGPQASPLFHQHLLQGHLIQACPPWRYLVSNRPSLQNKAHFPQRYQGGCPPRMN